MEEIQFTNETYEGRIDKKDQEQCRVVEVWWSQQSRDPNAHREMFG
jgi:hypothetical protein